VQDSVEVPEPPVMLVGVRLQVRPVPGEVELVRSTVPVNPFRGATVIVEVPEPPSAKDTLLGLAEIVKSGGGAVTVNITSAECDSVPLVPVTVTV